MTPLERAGKALQSRTSVRDWDTIGEHERKMFIDDARAVLLAIREPSEGMVEAAFDELPAELPSELIAMRRCLTAAIDAALAEGPL